MVLIGTVDTYKCHYSTRHSKKSLIYLSYILTSGYNDHFSKYEKNIRIPFCSFNYEMDRDTQYCSEYLMTVSTSEKLWEFNSLMNLNIAKNFTSVNYPHFQQSFSLSCEVNGHHYQYLTGKVVLTDIEIQVWNMLYGNKLLKCFHTDYCKNCTVIKSQYWKWFAPTYCNPLFDGLRENSFLSVLVTVLVISVLFYFLNLSDQIHKDLKLYL